MATPNYTFDINNIPTDPQVLAVYNGLSRVQRAWYNNAVNDRERTAILYVVAEEKKKPVCLLRWCTFICL